MGLSTSWERDARIEAEIRDRNKDILVNMWQLAQEDPSQCAAHFDCSMSVAERLSKLTLAQISRIASAGRFLFKPVFDIALVNSLVGEAHDPSAPAPTPESIAMSHSARTRR
jgi:hypothetical protein